MDIARPSNARQKRIRQALYVVIGLAMVGLITLGLSRLKPAAPSVDGATVWRDTVKRGPMLRQVRGLGTLVPEDILAIPATTDGRVDRKLMLPGTLVKPETILLELSNPELQTSTVDFEWQVKASEATYSDLKARLENDRLNQEAAVATVYAQYTEAKLVADRDKEIGRASCRERVYVLV